MAYKSKNRSKSKNWKNTTKPAVQRTPASRPNQKAPAGRPLSRNSKALYNSKAVSRPRPLPISPFLQKLFCSAFKKRLKRNKVTKAFTRRLTAQATTTPQVRKRYKRRRRLTRLQHFLGFATRRSGRVWRWFRRLQRRRRQLKQRRRTRIARWRRKKINRAFSAARIFNKKKGKKKAVKLPFALRARKYVQTREIDYEWFLLKARSRRITRLSRRVKKAWAPRKTELLRHKAAYRLQKLLPRLASRSSGHAVYPKLHRRLLARGYRPHKHPRGIYHATSKKHRLRRSKDYRVRGYLKYLKRRNRKIKAYLLANRTNKVHASQIVASPAKRMGSVEVPFGDIRLRRLLARFTKRCPLFRDKDRKVNLYRYFARRVMLRAAAKITTPARERTFTNLVTEASRRPARIQLPTIASTHLTKEELETVRRETGWKVVMAALRPTAKATRSIARLRIRWTRSLQSLPMKKTKCTSQSTLMAAVRPNRKSTRRALKSKLRAASNIGFGVQDFRLLSARQETNFLRASTRSTKIKAIRGASKEKALSRAQLNRRERLHALLSHHAKQTVLSANGYRHQVLKVRRPRVEVTIPERFQGNHSAYLTNFRTTYRKNQGSYLGQKSLKIAPLRRVAPANNTRRIGLTSLPKFESGYGITIPKKKVLRRRVGFEPRLESVQERIVVRNKARQLLVQSQEILQNSNQDTATFMKTIMANVANSAIRQKATALFSRFRTNRRQLKKQLFYRGNLKAKQLGGRLGGVRAVARLRRHTPHRLTPAKRAQKQRQLRAIFAAKRRAELKLSAWSPQYSLLYRRWSHPRVDGHPLQRDWTTRVEKRRRQLENESRALQGLEPKVYPDHAYIQLQYRDGNGTGAIGFARYRRVYRPRSSSNRWWEAPANRPIPFTHPLSRVSINETDHTKVNVFKEKFNSFRTNITFISRRSAPGKKLQRRAQRKRKLSLAWARGKARHQTALRSARSNLRWMVQAPLAHAERGNYWTQLDKIESAAVSSKASSRIARRARRQQAAWHASQLQADQGGDSFSILDRDNSRLYQRWLYGVERYLKQTDLACKGAGRREGENDQLLRYGATRRRFPALALRETSFDSHLQGFTRRISLPRFRRVNTIRFQRPRVKSTHYRRDSLMYSTSSRLRQQRNTVHRLAAKRYFSPQWRELLNQRATMKAKALDVTTNNVDIEQGRPSTVVSKRRFDSLPIQVQFTQNLERAHEISVPNSSLQFRASLLRMALYRRRRERTFLRLKKLARQRRMPSQSLLPPWQLAKRARTRAKVRRDMLWDTTEFVERAHHQLPWSTNVVGFSALQPTDRVFTESPFYPSGEELLESEEIAKESWVKKGFHLDWKETPQYPFHDYVPGRRKKSSTRRRLLKSRRKAVRRTPKQRRNRKKGVARLAMRSRLTLRIRRTPSRALTGRPFLTKFNVAGKSISLYPMSRRALSSAMPAVRSAKAGVARRTNTLAACEEASRTIGHKLVATASDHSTIAPLTFRTPIKVLPQSAEDKLREFRASVTLRERRYKRTAQYAAGLTRQLPHFISKMIQNRLQQAKAVNNPLTPQQVRAMVASIYWSLRVYLHVDPQGIKLALRDNNPTALANMREAMSSLSQQQNTDHAARTAWRRRLQYGQIHRAPNSNHFRFAWLRRFFPKKYAIFLEDSDEYGAIPISTVNIERLQPNRTSPAAWATNAPILTMESRARKLLRRRHTENTPRVETLLQTERRTPTVEPILHAAKTTVIGHRVSAPVNSFFSRSFSTYSALVYRSLRQHRRLAGTPEKALLPAAEALNTRERIKPAMTSLEQTGYLANHGAEVRNSALDVRVLRAKSARNGRYFVRLSDKRRALSDTTTAERLRLFLHYQELSKGHVTSGVARASRRFTYRSALAPAKRLFQSRRVSNKVVTPTVLTGQKRVSTQTWSRGRVVRPQFVFGERVSKSFYDWGRYDRSLATRMFVLKYYTLPRLKSKKLAETKKLMKKRRAKLDIRPSTFRRVGYTPLTFRLAHATAKANATRTTHVRAARIYHNAIVALAQQYEASEDYLELESLESEPYPFDEHRSELWDRLTLPWMKKERIVRDWVKNTKRWFTQRWGRDKAGWMPPLVFGEIRRRARQLEWRERDDNFHRQGWRNAFRLHPSERHAAPWFEPLLFRRAIYSTRHGAYRRYQFPREQKRLKWLQRYRKAFVAPRGRKRYLKSRHWPRLRFYNQRLFRSFFNLRNRSAVRRHFEKLSRRQIRTNGFAHSLQGLANRLDTVLVQLNLVPTVYWARVLAPTGLLRINGKVVTDVSYRLQPGDLIQLEQNKLTRFRHYFYPHSRYYEEAADWYRFSSAAIPGNFFYRPALRALIYRGLPTEEELRKSSRLNSRMFRWFRLDGAVSK